MKVKDLKAILNRYEGSDDLYLLLENGYGRTVRHAIECNKVARHYSHPDNQKEVHVWLGWES